MANDNRELVYRAQIETLVFAANTAIKTADADAFTSAARQLSALTVDINVSAALRGVASEIHDQLAIDMTDAGLNSMNESISGLAGAAGELQSAIDAAKKGKTDLFFPALADAAARALTTFKNLKEAVTNVQQDLRTATSGQLGDIPQTLQGLLTDLDNLRKAAKPS